jgi:hypothetical protein
MSLIIAAVSGKELATVYLAADHAEDDDIGQARPSHNAAPFRPDQDSLFDFLQFQINFKLYRAMLGTRIRIIFGSVPDPDPNPDPDPPDPHVFGPPGSGSFCHHAKIVRKTLIPTILRLFLTFYLRKIM